MYPDDPFAPDPRIHPSLTNVVRVPKDESLWTPEFIRTHVFGGDVDGVLRDIVNLAYNQHSQLTPITENHDARHETPESAAVRPAVRAAAGAGERGTVGQKAARRRAKSA